MVQLIFLKIFRPLPVLTTEFQSIASVTSKAVPSVSDSSVCWSPQCLIFTLTQGGRWWTLFFRLTCSVVLWGGRKGCCKQIILACARSVSVTLGLPPLPAHTAQALGCSTGNRLRPALGYMHLPGLSCSGSGTQVVLSSADSFGPTLCALPSFE